MNYLYSLYDALISINVPGDKARAVVDAMERDLTATLASKSDLQLVRQSIDSRFDLLSREIVAMRIETGKDFESLRLTMTVRLGSMLAVWAGLMLAALRYWVA